MIYFLHGEDSYRAKRKLEDIVSGYKKVHKSGLNLLYINCEKNKFSDFYSNFKITSMFDEKKMVVLKNIFENKDFVEEFLENIKKLVELKDIIVVFEEGKVDKRSKLLKALEKSATCQEFAFLQPAQIKKWAMQMFENNGAKINADALEVLLNFVGSDLWHMENEIIKLANYKKNSIVKKEDVWLQVKPKIENDIFKTIEALASKNKKLALSLLYKHLENGDNELYLLTMFAYQFKNLLIIKDLIDKGTGYGVLAKKSGLHPFVVQKTFYLCDKFAMPELKKIYRKIFAIDYDIKIGKVEPQAALELLLAEV